LKAGGARPQSVLRAHTAPNQALEPTTYSFGFAYASGGASPLAFVRQAKRGVSGRVQVPAEEGLTNHSYRVLHL